MGFLKSALVSSLLLASNAAALDSIVQKGTKFYTTKGAQFFMKGVAYQQDTAAKGGESTSNTFKDPLADSAACARDVPILKALGTNTIRTYAIDPTADHSACMKLLIEAGIYVVSDLGEPSTSINRDTPTWDVDLFDRYKAVVDELGQYENVIGFFAGNEVTNTNNNTQASAFVKAAVRDVKKYIKSKQDAGTGRWMGVGYAANDDDTIRVHIAQYFNCGPTTDSIDFWGYNIYSWCGDSSFTKSGYDKQVEFFSNYSVPVFFAEYGCNNDGAEGRIWTEVNAIYGDQMTDVISGGIVYMYFQETNDYGLVKLSGSTASTMKNYNALKTKLAAVKPSSTSSAAYTPTNSPQACPAVQANWKVAAAMPPSPDRTTCECMYNSLTCKPKDSLSVKSYGAIFDYICDADKAACAGIKAEPETGVYGPYSMCNAKQKLGAVLQAYYTNQKSAASACDFEGQAQIVSGAQAAASCSSVLASASSAASNAATATAGTTSSSASSSNAAVGGLHVQSAMTFGQFALGAYMLVAMGVGAGMVLL